jgi:hypothetical protein
MKTLKGFIETSSMGLILIFVLLPIRLAFVHFIGNNWFGSFGIITLFSVAIIYLSKKNKLGWFGRAFTRQMFKIHRGKRRYFVYSQLVLGLLFFSVTIYGIQFGNEYFLEQKQLVLKTVDVDNIEDFWSNDQVKLEDLPTGVALLFYVLLFRFDIFSIVIASVNDISDGWVLHFATVFIVEEIELIGILILTKITIKKID